MIRLLYVALAVSLLGSSAALGRSGVPSDHRPPDRELSNPGPSALSFHKLADLAVKNLSAIDGSTLTLAPTDGGLAREIVVPDGRVKKTLFVLLNDRFGTVSEGGDGGRNVAGVFRVTDTGIAAEYADGRSEMLMLNGSGGVSIVMNAPTGDVICMAWYPAGHRFSVVERKTALAAYAVRLGINEPRLDVPGLSVKHGCASTTGKIGDAQPRPNSSPMVYSPPPAHRDGPAKGSDILGGIITRALTFYTRKQAANVSSPDLAVMDRRLNSANNPENGFDNFYANFLAGHEGGYTENDGNGSPANFGINQGANPDIDVWNLTQAEAKQILHDRYWVASGADQLPTALAAVHGDTAINMGVGAANELLAQSGGDPQKYLELRDSRYRAIAASDSDKAKYLPIWMTRNEDLRNFVGDGGPADRERSFTAPPASANAAERQYCDAPNGYYPYAASCTSNWPAVPPTLPPQWSR